jgi:hypothetical protein
MELDVSHGPAARGHVAQWADATQANGLNAVHGSEKNPGFAEADLVSFFDEKEAAEPGLFEVIILIFKIDLMYIKVPN